MPFIKVQKDKAYFKRYQVKFARRRAGKTDYRARRRLVVQDKNKYETPRHRLVVRVTSNYIICQIIRTEIEGDVVVCAAYSSELPRYGLEVGLKNYCASYCTGLLLARRVLTKFGLADAYQGNTEVDGTVVKTKHTNDAGRTRDYWVSAVAEERKPFRAVLDVGIRATTTGARIFGALKGAADGGLDVPHNEKRFPGYDRDAKSYKPAIHRDRIFGKHISDYMEELQDDDPETFQKRFSGYHKASLEPDALEEKIKEVHAAIRADPSPAPKKAYRTADQYRRTPKKTFEQRKASLAAKKLARLQSLRAGAAAEDDE